MNRFKIYFYFVSVCVGFAFAVGAHAGNVTTSDTDATPKVGDIIAQLQQQISDIQKQIVQMQEQLQILIGMTTETTEKNVAVKTKKTADSSTEKEVIKEKTEVVYKISKNLVLGSENDEVYLLQKFLAKYSDIYPEAKITGYYGNLTEAAVKRFQKKYGIEVVGIVGPKTREKINTLAGNSSTYIKDGKSSNKQIETKDTISDTGPVVESIDLYDTGDSVVNWKVDGYSEKGFKIMWSKNNKPTYPTRIGDKYKYLSNPDANSVKLTTFNGSGVYYVRICEYLGGKCGLYSNQIEVVLTE